MIENSESLLELIKAKKFLFLTIDDVLFLFFSCIVYIKKKTFMIAYSRTCIFTSSNSSRRFKKSSFCTFQTSASDSAIADSPLALETRISLYKFMIFLDLHLQNKILEHELKFLFNLYYLQKFIKNPLNLHI